MHRQSWTKRQGTHKAPVSSLWLSSVQASPLKIHIAPTPQQRTLSLFRSLATVDLHMEIWQQGCHYVLQTNKKFLSPNILETKLFFFFLLDGGREWEVKQTPFKFPDFTQGQLIFMLRTNQLRNMLSRWVVCSLIERLPWSQHKHVLSRIDFLIQLVSSQSTST